MKEQFSTSTNIENKPEKEISELKFFEEIPHLNKVFEVFKENFYELYLQFNKEKEEMNKETDECVKGKQYEEYIDEYNKIEDSFWEKWEEYLYDTWHLIHDHYEEQDRNSYNCFSFCLSLMKKSGIELEEMAPNRNAYGGEYVDEEGYYISAEAREEAEYQYFYSGYSGPQYEYDPFSDFHDKMVKDSTRVSLETTTQEKFRDEYKDSEKSFKEFIEEKTNIKVKEIINILKNKESSRFVFLNHDDNILLDHMFCMMGTTPDGNDVLCIEKLAIGADIRISLLSEILKPYIEDSSYEVYIGVPNQTIGSYYPLPEEIEIKHAQEREKKRIEEEEALKNKGPRGSRRKRPRQKPQESILI